jgi:hypothetical protein
MRPKQSGLQEKVQRPKPLNTHNFSQFRRKKIAEEEDLQQLLDQLQGIYLSHLILCPETQRGTRRRKTDLSRQI